MEKLGNSTNAINWFEIPVTDLQRAKEFYETIFEIQLTLWEMTGMQMAVFPSQSPYVSGALVKSKNHMPGITGAVLYLNGNPDLQIILDRIEETDAEVTMPKTLIDEQTGYMAFFTDTEGNLVGLHSIK
jgi:predicted enzyme related to lactoylglutathione lyase